MINPGHGPVCPSCGHPKSLPIRACECCGSECDWGNDEEDEQREPDGIDEYKRDAEARGER